MKKKWKWILWGIPVILVLVQIGNPVCKNPPVKNDFIKATHAPDAVAATLQAACYDCHSNQTKWPWYAHVAPVSWFVSSDVSGGREHINFSEWPKHPEKSVRQLGWIYEVLAHDEMPPLQYTLVHSSARLSKAQHRQLLGWLNNQIRKHLTEAATP